MYKSKWERVSQTENVRVKVRMCESKWERVSQTENVWVKVPVYGFPDSFAPAGLLQSHIRVC